MSVLVYYQAIRSRYNNEDYFYLNVFDTTSMTVDNNKLGSCENTTMTPMSLTLRTMHNCSLVLRNRIAAIEAQVRRRHRETEIASMQ